MKQNFLRSLAAFALVAVTSHAATSTDETIVQLPTYAINASRVTETEKRVEASLDALRSAAQTPRAMVVELSALGTKVVTPATASADLASKTPAPASLRRS